MVNALGIGAQGLGGLTTVLDVKILIARRTRPVCRWRWFPTVLQPVTCISIWMVPGRRHWKPRSRERLACSQLFDTEVATRVLSWIRFDTGRSCKLETGADPAAETARC